MKRLIYIIFIFISAKVLPCSCGYLHEMTYADFYHTDYIFIGKVISVELDTSYMHRKLIQVSVERTFKSSKFIDIITVNTNSQESACGLSVMVDERWLIWTSTEDLRVSLCSRCFNLTRYKNNSISCNRESRTGSYDTISIFTKLSEFSSLKDGFHQFTFTNGNISSEGYVKNNVPDGNWTFYYPDQSVFSKGCYKDGKREDKWYYYTGNKYRFFNSWYGDSVSEYCEDIPFAHDSVRFFEEYQTLNQIDTNRINQIINYQKGIINGALIRSNYNCFLCDTLYYIDGERKDSEKEFKAELKKRTSPILIITSLFFCIFIIGFILIKVRRKEGISIHKKRSKT